MRIAFYAPMKPPTSEIPSGDRRVARSLMTALEMAGHSVELASEFQSREPLGDAEMQAALRDEGERIAHTLVTDYRVGGRDAPALWFTYHLYYKAPDWIGPVVATELGIPYVVAEASHAPKRAGGPWDMSHRAVEQAIKSAARIFGLNKMDSDCVGPLLNSPETLVYLPPFMELPENRIGQKKALRDRLSAILGIESGSTWLVTAAMMRSGDKATSYRILSDALRLLPQGDWTLIVAGDGPESENVEQMFEGLPVGFLGEQTQDQIYELFAAGDLFLWPAVNEAYGMALLEAQASGLPVIAGRTGGVPDIVRHEETGVLVPIGEARVFADAVGGLLGDPERMQRFGVEARRISETEHSIALASRVIDQEIGGLVA